MRTKSVKVTVNVIKLMLNAVRMRWCYPFMSTAIGDEGKRARKLVVIVPEDISRTRSVFFTRTDNHIFIIRSSMPGERWHSLKGKFRHSYWR